MVDNEPLSSKSSRLLSFFKIWILYINMYIRTAKRRETSKARDNIFDRSRDYRGFRLDGNLLREKFEGK